MNRTKLGRCACGQPLTWAGDILCLDCRILANRQARAYVRLYGDGPRLSGLTASCSLHLTKRCSRCFPDCAKAER